MLLHVMTALEYKPGAYLLKHHNCFADVPVADCQYTALEGGALLFVSPTCHLLLIWMHC